MNAEFNWWLLIVGLVVGAGLVWLVIADWSRRDQDLDQDERSAESAWIAQSLHERGVSLDPSDAEQVLALHRAYLHHLGSGIFDDELPADEPGLATTSAAPDRPADQAATGTATTVSPPADEPPTTETAPADEWLHTAPEDVATGGSEEAVDRGSLRSNPIAPRGAAGMDAEPPRPS